MPIFPQRSAGGNIIPHFQVPQLARFFISDRYQDSIHENAEARMNQLARLLQAGTPVSGLAWDRSDWAPRWDGMPLEPDIFYQDTPVRFLGVTPLLNFGNVDNSDFVEIESGGSIKYTAPEDFELSDGDEPSLPETPAPDALDPCIRRTALIV
ncbi:hypothetical protein Neosp_013835 [[Neocosmospora] mangrovei]